ncbi:hypothetical protein AB7W11_12060 [Providencia manganoxydans]|uniref:hypothetical protein n=1 Tax=Providencia manganoxydans TaxID=2923283 RepID=UPI0034E38F4B
MSNILQFTKNFEALDGSESGLKFDGGSGGGGDMESRVAKLESDVSHIQRDITEIKLDIREIKSDNKSVLSKIGELEISQSKTSAESNKSLIEKIDNTDRSLSKRIGDIESEIKTFKTVVKASSAVVSVILIAGAAIFGTYVNKILEALNGIVLK